MNTHLQIEHRNVDGLRPTDTRLLKSPLDFISEDHLRVRTMCAEIEAALSAEDLGDHEILRIRTFLVQDMPLLLQDEDCDLLPLLAERAEPDDEVPRLKARLDQEHATILESLPTLVRLFSGPRSAWSAADTTLCKGFLSNVRRHIILENAIMLPLARVRLNAADLRKLRHVMLRRRGLSDRVLPDRDAVKCTS
ncbi:MAG: hemerythrin domain-containing protein [Paracoccaceae bacterium]